MTLRVTDAEVKEIIETSITDTTPFITTANVLIDAVLSDDIAAGDLSDAVLEQMELWLSAHFVAVRQGAPKMEKAGDGAVTYFGKDGVGLESTPYGQQVLAIDITGKLKSAGAKTAKIQTIDFLA